MRILLGILVVNLLGCAQYMVLKAPGPLPCRNEVLLRGTTRSEVIGCFGEPKSNEKHMARIERLAPSVSAAPAGLTAHFVAPSNESAASQGPGPSAGSGAADEPMTPDSPTVVSSERAEVLTDTFVFEDGGKRNHAGSKAARILLYTAGDVFTLFLDQVIWMPVEMLAFEESKYHAEVDYTRSDDGRWHVLRSQAGTIDK